MTLRHWRNLFVCLFLFRRKLHFFPPLKNRTKRLLIIPGFVTLSSDFLHPPPNRQGVVEGRIHSGKKKREDLSERCPGPIRWKKENENERLNWCGSERGEEEKRGRRKRLKIYLELLLINFTIIVWVCGGERQWALGREKGSEREREEGSEYKFSCKNQYSSHLWAQVKDEKK